MTGANGAWLAALRFAASVIEWRGPAPFVFAAVVPDAALAELRWAARQASYGWGCVPVEAEVAGVPFATSLFPRDAICCRSRSRCGGWPGLRSATAWTCASPSAGPRG